MSTHRPPSIQRILLGFGLACTLLFGQAATAEEPSPEAAGSPAAAPAFYEGTWLAWDEMEKSSTTVLLYFASRVEVTSPEQLVAMGLSADRAQWVTLLRTQLESDPRKLARLRDELAPKELVSFTFTKDQFRHVGPQGTELAPMVVEPGRKGETVLRHFHVDGTSEAFRVRSLGPDGMVVRAPGSGWSWYVRAPAEVVEVHLGTQAPSVAVR